MTKIEKKQLFDLGLKNCSNKNCSQINPQLFKNFSESNLLKDGYQSRCKKCVSEYDALYYEKNKAKKDKYQANYYATHQEEIQEYLKDNAEIIIQKRKDNAEKNNKCSSDWYKENREHRLELSKIWDKSNLGKRRSISAKYRNKKRKAFLKLNEYNLKKIQDVYVLAETFGHFLNKKLSVDHIVPLQGKNVSGLHVPWNLQIITASDNSKKHNSFDGTYDNNGWRNR